MSISRFDIGPRMSQAVRAGGFLFVAGQVAEGADAAEQTAGILEKIDALLTAARMGRENVVSANIWLTDIGDFNAMNAVWDAWVAEDAAPARACVQSILAAPQYRVEIAVTAFSAEGAR